MLLVPCGSDESVMIDDVGIFSLPFIVLCLCCGPTPNCKYTFYQKFEKQVSRFVTYAPHLKRHLFIHSRQHQHQHHPH